MKEISLNKEIDSNQKSFGIYFSLKKYFSFIGFESFIWISGLIYLAFFSPVGQTHFTICPIKNMGFDFCPGCGLGNSISLLLNGYFTESFNTHVLGIPAIAIILHRIYTLIKFNLNKVKTTI